VALDRDKGRALFPSTRWTLVLAARLDPGLRREAIRAVVEPRWRALYVLGRLRGLSPEDAEDAVQGFFVRLVEGDGAAVLERLDPERGSLRAYLKRAFANHLENAREHDRAQKRGGGLRHTQVEELEATLASPMASPDSLFERTWAATIFDAALSALEAEYCSGARSGPFEILKSLFALGETASYAELAARHGMTVPQLKAFVHRGKARYRALVREKTAETLSEEDDIDGEIERLLQAMTA
jgi:DNA-directed RNA polymerase specialized sigma24 family protein